MLNTSALGKIADVLRFELAPTLSYSEKEQVYDIASSIEALIMEEKLQEEYRKQEVLYKANKILDASTIYDVLGTH